MHFLDRLQSAQNAAAPLIFSTNRYVHITPLLCSFHASLATGTLDAVLSPLLLPKFGTIYLLPLKFHHHLTHSNVTFKHIILPLHNFVTTIVTALHLI